MSHRIIFLVEHSQLLLATIKQLLQKYDPDVHIVTATDKRTAERLIEHYYFYQQSFFALTVMDVDIANSPGSPPNPKVGIELVKTLLQLNSLIQADPRPKIAVSSSKFVSVRRVLSDINKYQSGCLARDKYTSEPDFLNLIDSANTSSSINFDSSLMQLCDKCYSKPIEMLRLKFEEALPEPQIAKLLGVEPRTLRNYWKKLRNILGIDEHTKKDPKIEIEIKARRIGLIF